MADDPVEPYPGYVYTPQAAARAAGLQRAARRAAAALEGEGLFDTEPAHLAKTLAALADKGAS